MGGPVGARVVGLQPVAGRINALEVQISHASPPLGVRNRFSLAELSRSACV